MTLSERDNRLEYMVSNKVSIVSVCSAVNPIPARTEAEVRMDAISPIVWGALLLIPSALIVMAAAAGPGTIMHEAVQLAFRPFCHQAPDRSLILFGNTLVVCARCTGFYAGIGTVGVIAALAAKAGMRWHVPKAAFILIAPMAIDGAANLLGIWTTCELLRAATGLAAAVAVAAALLEARNETIRE